ncbi:MAG: permease prefix domain 1-containing protein [Planctomycetota bacterium]
MSSRHEHGDPLAGVWPAATPPSRDDIRDELADHLACSATEFAAKGLGPEQADQRARAEFGDVEVVARQLYWLHYGRRIMVQRFIVGGLAGVCAVLAIVLFITYRQSSETAGAVANLQTTLERMDPVDVPLRIVLRGADGTPLAGREVYVWSRRIEEPPFVLPNNESMMWNSPKTRELRVQVTLPAGYELLVTDGDGAVNLGRRSAGVYTATVNLEPELLAVRRYVDKQMLQMLQMMKDENRVLPSAWIGFAQHTFDLQLGRGPVEVSLRLPVLDRTAVRLLAASGTDPVSGIWMPLVDTAWARLGTGPIPGRQFLWLAIRGGGDSVTTWLRGFEKVPTFVEGVAQLELPLPAQATLYAGYEIRGEGRGSVPAVVQVDLPTPAAGEPPEIRLTAPPTGPQ